MNGQGCEKDKLVDEFKDYLASLSLKSPASDIAYLYPCSNKLPVTSIIPSAELINHANVLKQLGNKNFQNGRYYEAIKFYSRGIRLFFNPNTIPEASLYNNH